jgi:hypothetical protein
MIQIDQRLPVVSQARIVRVVLGAEGRPTSRTCPASPSPGAIVSTVEGGAPGLCFRRIAWVAESRVAMALRSA